MEYLILKGEQRKKMQIKREWVILLILGFLLGVIIFNLGGNTYLSGNGIFSKYFLSSFSAASIISEKYLCYIFFIRVLPLLILLLVGYTRCYRVAWDANLLWIGFSNGMILSSAVFFLGYQGILIYTMAYFPQGICYLPVYILSLGQCVVYRNQNWNISKYIFVILFMGLGIVLESLVNPYVLAFCLKKF